MSKHAGPEKDVAEKEEASTSSAPDTWPKLRTEGATTRVAADDPAKEVKAGPFEAAKVGGQAELITHSEWIDQSLEDKRPAGHRGVTKGDAMNTPPAMYYRGVHDQRVPRQSDRDETVIALLKEILAGSRASRPPR